MPNASNTTGWTSTDDGSDVPVRSSVAPKNALDSIVIGEHATETHHWKHRGKTETVTEINPHMMRLSAVTGIGLVLLGVGFYFGVVNLRGSIVQDESQAIAEVMVTITEQNTFDPTSITVEEGSTIRIENKNQNPQVLKSEMPDISLFPVQVIFRDPVTITVESGKVGSYTYVSETMPEEQKLTINVTPKITPQTSEPIQAHQPSEGRDSSLSIPLPFGGDTITPTAEISLTGNPEESLHTVTPTFENTSHGAESAVISLGKRENTENEVAFTESPIAINPYTVEAGKKNKNASALIAESAKKNQSLHSGAPLESLRTHKPYQTASTGPENLWILLVIASLGLGYTYARSLKKS